MKSLKWIEPLVPTDDGFNDYVERLFHTGLDTNAIATRLGLPESVIYNSLSYSRGYVVHDWRSKPVRISCPTLARHIECR